MLLQRTEDAGVTVLHTYPEKSKGLQARVLRIGLCGDRQDFFVFDASCTYSHASGASLMGLSDAPGACEYTILILKTL